MSACYICMTVNSVSMVGAIPLCKQHAPKEPPKPVAQMPPPPVPPPLVPGTPAPKVTIRHARTGSGTTWCGAPVDSHSVNIFAITQKDSQLPSRSNCKKCNKLGGFGEHGDDPDSPLVVKHALCNTAQTWCGASDPNPVHNWNDCNCRPCKISGSAPRNYYRNDDVGIP